MTLLNKEKLDTLLNCLQRTKNVEGHILDFGVYQGGSLVEMARTAASWETKHIIGFDSFEGLPFTETHQMYKGRFNDTNVNHVRRLVSEFGVEVVVGLVPYQLYKVNVKKISFAHIDLDLGLPTLSALIFVDHRMEKNGVIVVDDFDWHETPYIREAVESFRILSKHQYYFEVQNRHQAILRRM